MLSSGIIGIQISKLTEDSRNKQPFQAFCNFCSIYTRTLIYVPKMQNLMENLIKCKIFLLELNIFMIIQLAVICTQVVDFRRPKLLECALIRVAIANIVVYVRIYVT